MAKVIVMTMRPSSRSTKPSLPTDLTQAARNVSASLDSDLQIHRRLLSSAATPLSIGPEKVESLLNGSWLESALGARHSRDTRNLFLSLTGFLGLVWRFLTTF